MARRSHAVVSVEVAGLARMVKDLTAAGVGVEDMREVFAAIAADAAETVKSFMPERSGDLKGTVRSSKAKNRASVTIGNRAKVPYAGPQNYGWGSAAANFKHGRYATGIRGAFAGHNFIAAADAIVGPKAARQLEAGIDQLLTRKGLK